MRRLGRALAAAGVASIGAAVAGETPLAIHIHSDKAMFQVLILPGKAGSNNFVLQLMNGDGTLLSATSATLILQKAEGSSGTLERQARLGADGYWHVERVPLTAAGRWHVRIAAESVFRTITLEDEFELPAQ